MYNTWNVFDAAVGLALEDSILAEVVDDAVSVLHVAHVLLRRGERRLPAPPLSSCHKSDS